MLVRLLPAVLLLASAWAAAPVIPARMHEFVNRHEIAGAVTLVAQHGELVAFDAVGDADREAHRPMRKDTIFQIMSMTKTVTGVGVMILAEEGKLSVGAPVSRYLPEFAGKDITLRDLMTHTSGLRQPPDVMQLYTHLDRTLAEGVREFAKEPLEFTPGTRWKYSTAGIDVLGRIIEVVSGQPYAEFIAQRILKPLQMNDSFFFPDRVPDKINRIAMVYRKRDGQLERSGADILGGDPALHRKGSRYPGPGFGMYSTASDLWHFYEMMRGRGSWHGVRILSPASVEVMTMLHTGTISPSGWLVGAGYGLTWEVIKEPLGTLNFMSIGTYGHSGAFGTYGWVDPKRDVTGVFLIQREGGAAEVRDAFFAMAAAAVP